MKRGNTALQGKWRQIVREYGQSGLTERAFCQKHGHSHHQFRYWKQKLGKDAPGLRFVQAVAKSDTGSTRGSSDEGLTLEIGHARIKVRSGFDRALLLQTVQALGGDT